MRELHMFSTRTFMPLCAATLLYSTLLNVRSPSRCCAAVAIKVPGYPIPALETSSFTEDVVYWHLVADTVELLGKK